MGDDGRVDDGEAVVDSVVGKTIPGADLEPLPRVVFALCLPAPRLECASGDGLREALTDTAGSGGGHPAVISSASRGCLRASMRNR